MSRGPKVLWPHLDIWKVKDHIKKKHVHGRHLHIFFSKLDPLSPQWCDAGTNKRKSKIPTAQPGWVEGWGSLSQISMCAQPFSCCRLPHHHCHHHHHHQSCVEGWRSLSQIPMCVQPLLKGGHSFLFPSLIFSGVKMGMFVKDTYHDVGPDHGNGE